MAALLLAGSLVEIASGARLNGWGGGVPVAVVVAILGCAPLALTTRFPLPVAALLAATGGIEIGLIAPDQAPFEPFVALVVAFYGVGVRVATRASVAAVVTVAAAGVGVIFAGLNAGASNTLPAIVWVAAAWGGGRVVRARTTRAAELEDMTIELAVEREERERAAVVSERARIARELHDVVAHNVSVIVLHAEAGKRALGGERRTQEAFDTIESVGRETVDELRRLLGILRRDEELTLAPPPSLAHLDLLVESVRQAGVPVELAVSGTRNGLSPGLDLAGYRIVQEALTNVLKHARARRVAVTVVYAADGLELEVSDDGDGGAPADAGGGHGLVGMRERAALYGGSLRAGPRPGGGFGVRAVLPLRDLQS
ncbi:MAG TPA: histidine kinase [Gaiellaceae bacterium]|nr:histidine kinase [Gaiellaceae bacterium]